GGTAGPDAHRGLTVGDHEPDGSGPPQQLFRRLDHDPGDDPARRGDVAPPPSDGPTPPLHILAFAGSGEAPVRAGLLRGLGEGGDHVLRRQPGPHLAGRDLGPQVRTEGVEQLPGVKGELSPLLRLDGLPSDADVILGYGHTAGIADVRLDAYP